MPNSETADIIVGICGCGSPIKPVETFVGPWCPPACDTCVNARLGRDLLDDFSRRWAHLFTAEDFDRMIAAEDMDLD